MNTAKYILTGFFSSSDVVPSFVIPVFRHQRQFFVQEIDENDNIERLRAIDHLNFPYQLKYLNSGIKIVLNSPAIYGFAFSNSDIIFRQKHEMSIVLRNRIEDISENPFIYADILNFLGETEKSYNAIYRIHNMIAFRNKDLAEAMTRIELSKLGMDASKREMVNWIDDKLITADNEGFISYWNIFDELHNLIRSYGYVYIKCKLVRSVIGTSPKIRTTIRSLGFYSTRIGQTSSEVPINLSSLQNLKTISTYVLISEARVFAENEIVIAALDDIAIQKRYFKKNYRKVVKGTHHQDYIFQILQS